MGLPDPHYDRQFYAGVPARRFFAFLIDGLIVAGLSLLMLLTGALVGLLTAGLGTVIGIVLFVLSGFAYRYLMVAHRSATLGMMATGIELRTRQGERLDRMTALIHTAGFYLSFTVPVLMVIGWILMATSPHRRLIHDLLPGTTAINRPV